jgi:hypothetical protein
MAPIGPKCSALAAIPHLFDILAAVKNLNALTTVMLWPRLRRCDGTGAAPKLNRSRERATRRRRGQPPQHSTLWMS